MNLSRTLAVTKRVFKDVKNDKRTIALILIAPIFAMFVFGLAFSGNVEDVSTIIVNHDNGFVSPSGQNTSISKDIISNLNTSVMNITYMTDDAAATKEVQDGKSYAVIIFPENFTQEIIQSQTGTNSGNSSSSTEITIKDDESIVNIKTAITGSVADAVTTTMENNGVNPPVKLSTDPIYGQNAQFIDFVVPGVMGFIVYLLTTLLTLLAFVGERTSGTLERLLSSPIRESEMVGGYAIAFGIIGTVQAAFLLLVAIAVFRITVIGDVFLAFLVVALLAVVSQALGILLSNLAKTEGQAVQFVPFIILPVFLLSGVFWPIQAIPVWLRPLSYLVPPTYAVDACRAVLLKGWGLSRIWPDILALILFAVLFLILATLSLKRRKD
ncbi:ABC-2 type transporter [Methanobacterium lacus]|uniref:ABC-2 type transporter n=1 Tax=Methanobacterium lacus (strain AL-21) TaxID=877455 RepID=F0TBK7_METLA|nr:ABC transporter permease [Methanobacterium lacus]ADZ10276.1 ABC-2 type transporter [Methanobacterium lacus]